MNKSVFLFPGQGSQEPGMAKDLFESYESVKALFRMASEACGKDMEALLFEGSAEDLKATENAQAAIVLASLAAKEALRTEGFESSGAAGHSLGEYTALVDAGVLSAEDALRAVTARGRFMGEASAAAAEKHGEVGMAAVIGLGPEDVRSVVENHENVWSANENGPKQVVIAGTRTGMSDAEEAFKAAGARRVLPLKVSGPFHTPLMSPAADALATVFEGIEFANPVKAVWSNVSAGQVNSGEEAKQLLIDQITGAVRWVDLTTAAAAFEPSHILEVGPGRVLSGLWAKSGLNGTCVSAGNRAAIEEMKKEA